MRPDTREHILACGGRIIHHKGFTATGLHEILQAAGVPKGSFYFYFKSKDDFGLALIDHYSSWIEERLRTERVSELLQDESLSPIERLRRYFLWFRDLFAKVGFIKGCPIGNLVQELGDVNPAFREKLNASLQRHIQLVATLLQEAQEQNTLPPLLSPDVTARFIVSAWQGALLRMKAVAGPEPLDNFLTMVFEVLLA